MTVSAVKGSPGFPGVFSGRLFLIMAAEMEPRTTDGDQDLVQFWEEIAQQRLKCHVLQDVKPTSYDHRNIHAKLLQVMASSRRLEQKLDRCLWTQKVFIVLVMGLTALWGFTLYIHYSAGYSNWTTAKN